jgi:ribosome-associated translation inhibitor RaiA
LKSLADAASLELLSNAGNPTANATVRVDDVVASLVSLLPPIVEDTSLRQVGGGVKVHIAVTGGNGTVDGRTRAYLESRLFNTLRPIARDIKGIGVSLTDHSIDMSPASTCRIVLDFTSGEQIVALATADWPYAAIDEAVTKAWKEAPTRSREPAYS